MLGVVKISTNLVLLFLTKLLQIVSLFFIEMIQKTQRKRFFDYKVDYDWWLLGAVGVQTIIGLAFLASALSNRVDFLQEFIKQLVIGLWVGMIVAFVLSRLDYHILFKLRHIIIGITFFTLLYIAAPLMLADLLNISRLQMIGYLDVLGISPYMANNAVRWIYIFGITNFQPAELAKLAILIYFASYINQNAKENFTWDLYKKPFYALVLVCVAIVVQPDLGSVVIIVAIIASVLWVAKIPFKYILVGVSVASLIGGALIASQPWRMTRVLVWMSESVCQNYAENTWNYNICSSFQIAQTVTRDDELMVREIQKAVASGGLFGVGYSRSDLKNRIPESTTDGIIGVIGAEGGFFLVILVMTLYLIIFLRGMKIASEASDEGGRSLAVGISVWIILQSFWNIAGMVGLFPMKGLPLPFISEGGTAMVINLMTIGILLNISTQKDPDYLAKQALNQKMKQRTVVGR